MKNKETKFFTDDWQETTPDKAYYVQTLTWDKDGKVKSSRVGVRSEEFEGKGLK